MGNYRLYWRANHLRYYLLIQTFGESNEKNIYFDDRVCRFLVFDETNPLTKDLLYYYQKFVYQINHEQYNKIKKYNSFQNFNFVNKMNFFTENNLEEFLI